MQNVIRYGTDGPQPVGKCGDRESFGLVMVVQNGASLNIMSGNFIARDDAKTLHERVMFLSRKTPEELRQLYRARLRQPPEANSKGASIGLIEIARRSSIPLQCEMRDTGKPTTRHPDKNA